MGKTIQAISLILANKPDPGSNEQLIEWKLSDEKHGFGGSPAVSRGKTLIVVPTIALRQWRSEIHRFSKEGSLKVVIYHGENREAEANNLREADVVLTTYKIIEIEHRKATAGTKIECSICGKKFYPEKLRIHRKYFCGDDAERTEAQARTISNGRRRPLSAAVSSYNERDSGSEDSISRQKRSNKKSAQTAPTATASSKRINQNRPSSIKCPDSSDDEISRQKKVNKQAAAKAAKGASAPNVRQAKKSPKDSVSESSGDEIIPQKKSNKKVDTATKKTKFVAKKVNSTDVINQKTPARNTEKSKTQSPSSSRRSERVAVSTSNKPPPRYVYDSEEIVTEFDSEDSCSKAASSSDESSSEASSESAVEKPVIKRRKVAIASSAKQKTEGKAAPDPKPSTQIGSEEVEQEIRRALLKHARDNKNRAPKVSVLHNISWFRIILDEAHLIKDRSTSTAHASFALVSLNKWCLTGTPLQNRVGELYSLVRFLRLDPHAFYYCRTKGCSCKSLHYVSFLATLLYVEILIIIHRSEIYSRAM